MAEERDERPRCVTCGRDAWREAEVCDVKPRGDTVQESEGRRENERERERERESVCVCYKVAKSEV